MKIRISENIEVLQQGELLLQNMSDTVFAHPVQLVYNSTIGEHFRHNLDHYLCFFDGLDSASIDYAARRRDTRLEQDRRYAMAECARVCERLQSLAEDLDGVCSLTESDVGPGRSGTSFKRELEFLLSHTIHHYAIVATMCQLQGIAVEDDFGVAPSTLRYRAAQSSLRSTSVKMS